MLHLVWTAAAHAATENSTTVAPATVAPTTDDGSSTTSLRSVLSAAAHAATENSTTVAPTTVAPTTDDGSATTSLRSVRSAESTCASATEMVKKHLVTKRPGSQWCYDNNVDSRGTFSNCTFHGNGGRVKDEDGKEAILTQVQCENECANKPDCRFWSFYSGDQNGYVGACWHQNDTTTEDLTKPYEHYTSAWKCPDPPSNTTCEEPKQGVTWGHEGEKPYATQTECSDECYRTSECNYWSFDTKGNKCYHAKEEVLKSWKRGAEFVSGYAGANGCCRNVGDRIGVDSKNYGGYDESDQVFEEVKDARECASKCHDDANCKVWSWIWSEDVNNPNRCYLSSSKDDPFSSGHLTQVTSYYKCTPVPECPLNHKWNSDNHRGGTIGVDGVTFDVTQNLIQKSYTDSEVECAQLCLEEPRCKAWSWKWESNDCYLGADSAKYNEITTFKQFTGYKKCSIPKQVSPGYLSDKVNYTLLNSSTETEVSSWQECASFCNGNEDCYVWTYVKTGECWWDKIDTAHVREEKNNGEHASGFTTVKPLTYRYSPQVNYTSLQEVQYNVQKSWQECASFCNGEKGCRVWTFRHSDESCWWDDFAKDDHTRETLDRNDKDKITSGFTMFSNEILEDVAECPLTNGGGVGTDRVTFKGTGYKQVTTKDTRECANYCFLDAQCNRWSFVWSTSDSNANKCYLDVGIGEPDENRPNWEITSHVKCSVHYATCPLTNGGVGTDGVTFEGKGYNGGKFAKGTRQCARFCLNDAKCNRWSFVWSTSEHNANNCYLDVGIGEPDEKDYHQITSHVKCLIPSLPTM